MLERERNNTDHEHREKTILTLEKAGFPVARLEDGTIAVGEKRFSLADLDNLTPAGIADLSETVGSERTLGSADQSAKQRVRTSWPALEFGMCLSGDKVMMVGCFDVLNELTVR